MLLSQIRTTQTRPSDLFLSAPNSLLLYTGDKPTHIKIQIAVPMFARYGVLVAGNVWWHRLRNLHQRHFILTWASTNPPNIWKLWARAEQREQNPLLKYIAHPGLDGFGISKKGILTNNCKWEQLALQSQRSWDAGPSKQRLGRRSCTVHRAKASMLEAGSTKQGM